MAVSWTPVPVRSQSVRSERRASAWRAAGDDLAEFGEGAVGRDEAGGDGVVQFAEDTGLRQPVGDIGVGADDGGGIDLVLVLGVRAHGGDVLAGGEPFGLQDRLARRAWW